MRFLLLFLISFSALADDLTISWDSPTTREDGSALPLEEIDSYTLSHSIDDVAQPLITTDQNSYTLNDVQNGTHVFRVLTTDTDGLASPYSDPIARNVSDVEKAPISTTTITITVSCNGECEKEIN